MRALVVIVLLLFGLGVVATAAASVHVAISCTFSQRGSTLHGSTVQFEQ